MKQKAYIKFIYMFSIVFILILLGTTKSKATEEVEASCGDGVVAKMYLNDFDSYIVIEPENGRTNVEMKDYNDGVIPCIQLQNKRVILQREIAFKKIIIKDGITKIGANAFSKMRDIEVVDFSEAKSLKIIGNRAFSETQIESVTIPNNCKEIGEGVFENCGKLTSIKLNEGLEKIGSYAFYGCEGLKNKEIEIPISLNEAGDNVLPDGIGLVWYDDRSESQRKLVANLKAKNYLGDSFIWGISDNLIKRNYYLGKYVKGTEIFDKNDNKYELIIEPLRNDIDYINTKIEFNIRDTLKSNTNNYSIITVENGINEIGEGVFKNLETSEIDISKDSTLNKIDSEAFWGMQNLQTVKLSNSSEIEIGNKVFENCKSLKDIDLEKAKTIGYRALANTNLEKVILGKNLVKIEDETFSGCTNLKTVKIPEKIKNISANTFKSCDKLETIIINSNNEELYNNLKTIGLENKVVEIENGYIYNGKLYKNEEIAKSIRYIVTKSEDTTLLTDIEIDEENGLMEIEDYIPYKLTTKQEDGIYIWQDKAMQKIYPNNGKNERKYKYYIWQSDREGNVVKVGDTSQYTGFYSGFAFKNGEIITDTMIALPKGTNISKNSNISVDYEIVNDLTGEQLKEKKETKDVYLVNEIGSLVNNVFEQTGNSALYGDVNLDGVVDILDVIQLNKYLAGIVELSDQQKKNADCYFDSIIDDFDSMALAQYVVLLIVDLPKYPEEIDSRKEIEKNDEFYKENIKSSVGDLDLVKIAKLIKNKLNSQGNVTFSNKDMKVEELYKEGKFLDGINGSSYVGMCLYQYGLYTDNKDIVNYIEKDGGVLNISKFYNISDEDLNSIGWQKIKYISKDDLVDGDIIVSESKVQIYEGYGAYACNNEEEAKSKKITKVIDPEDGMFIIRTVPESGKIDDGIEWKVENNTLKLDVGENISGNVGDDINVPWKASAYKISKYSVTADEEYLDTAIKLVGSSMTSAKTTTTKVELITDSVKDVVKAVKEKMQIGYNQYVADDYKINFLSNGKFFISMQLELEPFYKEYINGKSVKGKDNAETFYNISKIVKEQITQRASSGKMTYSDTVGIKIPTDIYSKNGFGIYADCSSYVSMCLYEYGINKSDKNMIDFIWNYRVEAGGSNIGRGGQITASQFYYMSKEKLDKLGLEMLEYNSDSDLQKGDILVTTQHVEIYSGNGKVFSCGDNPPMQSLEWNKSSSMVPGNGCRIIRIK